MTSPPVIPDDEMGDAYKMDEDDDLDWVVSLAFASEDLTLEAMEDAMALKGDWCSWKKGDLPPDWLGTPGSRSSRRTSGLHLWDECDSWDTVKQCLAEKTIPLLRRFKEADFKAASALTLSYYGDDPEVSFKLPPELIAACHHSGTTVETRTSR